MLCFSGVVYFSGVISRSTSSAPPVTRSTARQSWRARVWDGTTNALSFQRGVCGVCRVGGVNARIIHEAAADDCVGQD